MKQYKIKSNKTFAPIQKLIDLGGDNHYKFNGLTSFNYYYIQEDGIIENTSDEEILKDIEEIFLDEFPKRMRLSPHYGNQEFIVITYHRGMYICVKKESETNYAESKAFEVFSTSYAEEIKAQIKIKEVKMSEIEKIFGCKVKIIKDK